jgi:hypothetical protein
MPTTRTTPTNHKQNNNNSKHDNPAYKLAPEKLKIKPTNTYNQPTTMEYKCHHMIDQVQQTHKRAHKMRNKR